MACKSAGGKTAFELGLTGSQGRKQPPRSSIHWAAWQRSLGTGRTGNALACSFGTMQDWWRRAAAYKTLGRLPVLGDWEYGNCKKSKGNRFFLWLKGPGKRMDWGGCQDECTRPWYPEKGEDVISCNPGQIKQGWPQKGNCESLLLMRQQGMGMGMENLRIWRSLIHRRLVSRRWSEKRWAGKKEESPT